MYFTNRCIILEMGIWIFMILDGLMATKVINSLRWSTSIWSCELNKHCNTRSWIVLRLVFAPVSIHCPSEVIGHSWGQYWWYTYITYTYSRAYPAYDFHMIGMVFLWCWHHCISACNKPTNPILPPQNSSVSSVNPLYVQLHGCSVAC